jgi:hypothetical protein
MEVEAKYKGRRIEALLDFAAATVKFGVLRGTGDHPNAPAGVTTALVAAWNEFGTATAPARPFLRNTVREHNYYRAELGRVLKDHLLSGTSPILDLKLLGERAAADVRNKISSGEFEPNAESTIIRKSTSSGRKETPLVDTGHLRQSIQSQVEGGI